MGGLLNFTTDDLWDKLSCELCEGAAGGFAGNDLGHLLPDGSNLRGGGVCGLLDLVGAALGESNGEKAEKVVVGGFDGDICLNQRLPLSDEGTELVGCEIKTMEVGQAVLALNFVDTELDLSECVVLILLKIRQRNLENSALQRIVCVLETGSSIDESLSDAVKKLDAEGHADYRGHHTLESGRRMEPSR